MEESLNRKTPASFSPSFSTYSGDRLAETAERVGRSFVDDDYRDKEDEEFEFAILQTDGEAASSSRLVFSVFDQNLVSREAVLTPLKDLFLRERKEPYPPSSDEEEEEDLDEIPSEIYCPWTPARSTTEMSPSGGCRKSKSIGSSSTRRWRIRDLMKRSHSDGKQSLNFLNTSESPKKEKEKVSAHEKFYLRNKAMKEEDKRKSYMPYKQDLVGIFANINRFGKTFPPF